MTKCYFVLKGGLLDNASNLHRSWFDSAKHFLKQHVLSKNNAIGIRNFALMKFFEMKDALQPIGISAF